MLEQVALADLINVLCFMQIVRFMEENDMHLPALAVCHGVSYYPETKKLAAFTSDRFFRGLAASNRCPVSEEDSCICVPESEAAATETLFRIIESEAKSSMTLLQMMELVAITKFYMADIVTTALPHYFGAAMQQMNAHEVRYKQHACVNPDKCIMWCLDMHLPICVFWHLPGV
jgi:hypothetical protein